jgi:hypothetical protein
LIVAASVNQDDVCIASPELLPDFASLPHVICSRARSSCGGDDEAGEHDNTQ